MSSTTLTLPTGKLGININPVDSSGGDYPMANAFRGGGQWFTYSLLTPLPDYSNVGVSTLDAAGWPTEDFALQPLSGGLALFGGAYLFTAVGRCDLAGTGVQFSLPTGQTAYNDPTGNGHYPFYIPATNMTVALVTPNGFPGYLNLGCANTRRLSTDTTATGLTDVCLWRALDPNNPGTHVTDFHGPGDVFTHVLINKIKNNFDFVRYMQWCQVTNIGSADNPGPWDIANRVLPGDFIQGVFQTSQGKWGVAWELCILFSNLTNTDCWLNTPHTITPACLAELALVCQYGSDGKRAYTGPPSSTTPHPVDGTVNPVPGTTTNPKPVWPPLNAGLNYYIEESNETWNSQFYVFGYDVGVVANAPASSPLRYGNPPDATSVPILQRAHVQRTVLISDQFRAVCGDAAMGSRVRILLGAQENSNPALTASGSADDLLNYYSAIWNNPASPYTTTPRPANYRFWGVCSGAYSLFNISLSDPTNPSSVSLQVALSASDVLSRAKAFGFTPNSSKTDQQNAIDAVYFTGPNSPFDFERSSMLAQAYGLNQIIYEGCLSHADGSVNDFTRAVNADPRMAGVTTAFIEKCLNSGTSYCHYNTIIGNWALWNSVFDLTPSPRFQGLQAVSARAGNPYTPQRTIPNIATQSVPAYVTTPAAQQLIPLGLSYFPTAGYVSVTVRGNLAQVNPGGGAFAIEVDGIALGTGNLPYPGVDQANQGIATVVVPVPKGAHTLGIRALQPLNFVLYSTYDVTWPAVAFYTDILVASDDFSTMTDGQLLGTEAGGGWHDASQNSAIQLAYSASHQAVTIQPGTGGTTAVEAVRTTALATALPTIEFDLYDGQGNAIPYGLLRYPSGGEIRIGIQNGYLFGWPNGGSLTLIGGSLGSGTTPRWNTLRLDLTGTTATFSINGFAVGTLTGLQPAVAGMVPGLCCYASQVTDLSTATAFRYFKAIDRVVGFFTPTSLLGSAWFDRLLRHGS